MPFSRCASIIGGLLIALFAIVGCEPSSKFELPPDKSSLVGAWLRAQPAGDGYEGVVLEADGRASVLGIGSLQAAHWDWENGSILLAVYEDNTAVELTTTVKRMMVVELDRHTMTLETQSDYFSGRYLRRDDAVSRIFGRVVLPVAQLENDSTLTFTLESDGAVGAESHRLLSHKLRIHSKQVDGTVPFSLYFVNADLQQGYDYQLVVELADAGGRHHHHAKHSAAINRNGDPDPELLVNLVPVEVKSQG
ncbi:lipocalin family protein [Corallincola spongiicola]|uniref:Lipocalin-like domain-containing protein n=1 Tax=Corallincola spongiicola TaxID=2520508 RepID=A0ABY1WLP8_9GAMM|nr:lipocalin family protein [Corallincola spongiicola]TAA41847.1 hypothetical protein EXY25_16575 [Corallincola spongiicola]